MKLKFTFIFLFASFILHGQTVEPSIKFMIGFTDGIGNKDSVIIGFDPLGSPLIEPVFNEVNIKDQPFRTPFECRAADKGGQEILAKYFVDTYDPEWCISNAWFAKYISLNIYAEYFPVTIHWDSMYFKEDCRDWTHFTRNWDYLFHPEFVNGQIVRFVDQSKVVITKTYLDQTETFRTSYLHELDSGGKGKIYVIFLGLAWKEPTNAVHGASALPFSIHPNPAQSWIEVTWPSDAAPVALWRIHDSLGRVVSKSGTSEREGIQEDLSLDVAYLPAGTYWLCVYARDGQMALSQFVKE